MNEWFIKIFRSLIDWEWYDDINTCRLFIHLLLKVNYIDTKWRWIEIKKGERLTSYWNLSSEIGISVMQVRTCLRKLKSTGEITIKTTNNYTLIKLNNYEKYNWDNTQDNKPITNEQQTSNKQVTTNKESKKDKKENNIINTNISKPTKIKIFEDSSFEYQICKKFLDTHIELQTPSILYQLKNGDDEKIIQKWCDEIRKLREIDNFTETQISFIINFTLEHDFWKDQILSIEKFRKKKDGVSYFVKMIDEAKRKTKPLPKEDNIILADDTF